MCVLLTRSTLPGVRASGRPIGRPSIRVPFWPSRWVTITRPSPTYILGLFGIHSITVSSTATAKIEALGQVAGHVAPYAVPEASYNNGTATTLFDQSQPGAYGTVDLPASGNNTGGSCSGNTNAGTPTNVKDELSDQLPSNPLVVGGCLSVKSGASQPSATVVNQMPPY